MDLKVARRLVKAQCSYAKRLRFAIAVGIASKPPRAGVNSLYRLRARSTPSKNGIAND